MKTEKKGKIYISIFGMLLFAVTNIFKQQFAGFLFNPLKFQNPNVLFALVQIFIVSILFCVGNWSITTLLDGEGKFRDIVMVFGYSCYSIAIIQIPLTIVTNICSYSELPLIQVISGLSMIWFFEVLFFGIMTIHQYSVFKMLATTLLTIVAMMVLAFIYLLFFNFISQFVLLFISIYKELSFRLF
jgi:hypothetical protein